MQVLTAITLGLVVTLVINNGIEYAFLAVFIFINKPQMVFLSLGIFILLKRIYLKILAKKELKLLEQQVGRTLLLLAQTLKAGMSLDQGFRLVESSLEAPLKKELKEIIKEVDLGKSWIAALNNSEDRIPVSEWHSFITAASLALNLGGNLAEIMTGLANINSQKEAVGRKIQSVTAQGRLTASILAFLPLAFMAFYWFFDRPRIRIFTNSPLGQFLLVIAFLLDVAGFLMIRRISEVRW